MVLRRSHTAILAVAVALTAVASMTLSASARAADVLVMSAQGHVHEADQRFLTGGGAPELDTAMPVGAPIPTSTTPLMHTARVSARRPAPQVTVVTVLAALARRRQITAAQERGYLRQWRAALSEERRLASPERSQLTDVTELLHGFAVDGEMTASRLPLLFLTLTRNMQWWAHGPMLSYGQRVQFSGSLLEWEYYPGEGIELQVLGTFSEANGLYEAGRPDYPQVAKVVSEMIPLGVLRDGRLAWEYDFDWDGGSPPWVSAMAQATGIEALTNAYLATKNRAYLQVAHRALALLQTPPPVGVGIRTSLGMRFLQYSFAPSLDIINAFLQTLIGVDDYALASGDPTARTLFAEGNAQAQAEVASFNTGAWSLYQPGSEDDLSYHELVTGFLARLCTLTHAPAYCTTASAFTADLHTPPTLSLLTHSARAGHAFDLSFRLSKESHVGVVLTSGAATYLYTSAWFGYGSGTFAAPRLRRGTYTVRLSATDLAGNYRAILGTVTVTG